MPPPEASPRSAPRLSVVVPCYNEGDNLPLLLDRLRGLCRGRGDVIFVLVDNGSTDHSAAVLDRCLPPGDLGPVRRVHVPKNQGYGHGILAGLAAAEGDYLGWTHADLQTDPADVLAAWDVLLRCPAPASTLVRGRRMGREWLDAAFTFGMSVFVWGVLRLWLSDINAQPKLFPRALYESMRDPPEDFSLDLFLLIQARRLGYAEATVPVVFARRQHGEAKGGGSPRAKVRLMRRTMAYVLKLRRKLPEPGRAA